MEAHQNNCQCSMIKYEEVREAPRKMGRNKYVGPDQIPIEAWRCLGDDGVKWLTSLFNKKFRSQKMSMEWRLIEVIPIYKNKGGAQVCALVEFDTRLQCETKVSENQFDFMPGRSSMEAQERRMEVAEMRMLRWTCGKIMLDMLLNVVFRENLEVGSIINKLREERLRWVGHVMRCPITTLVSRVEALTVDGVRRGRPKRRWEDCVKINMRELLLTEDMTSDSNVWSTRVRIDE
ncbi:uncharacterized protein [Rutidosis leptorrhynchoides]|uniref:uncharacterized protein n=1 Tax=Rutidosis leptorrhynchoides TaxID=125765 RepID=UPI003A9A5B71